MILTVTADAWTELTGIAAIHAPRIRTVEALPPVWIVDSATAPPADEPAPSLDAELLDADKRETVFSVQPGERRLWARVRSKGGRNRLILTGRPK